MKRIVVTYSEGSVCQGVIVEESAVVIVVVLDSAPNVKIAFYFQSGAWFDSHGVRIESFE